MNPVLPEELVMLQRSVREFVEEAFSYVGLDWQKLLLCPAGRGMRMIDDGK